MWASVSSTPPEEGLGETDPCVGGSKIPVYRQRALKLSNALRGPVRVHLNDSETKMSQRLFGRDRQRLDCERFGRRQASRAVVAGVRRSELAGCESNPDDGVDVLWIERASALEQPSGLRQIVRDKPLIIPAHTLKIEVHRVGIGRPFAASGFGDDELRVEGVGKAGDDLVLHVEKVGDRLVEAVRPKMICALGVDELDVHPDAVGGALDAAFEDIADVELAPDLFEVDRLALEVEGGVSSDHPHSAHLRKVGGEALGDAVDEIVLPGIAPDIGEGKNHDRKARRPRLRFIGSDRGWRGTARIDPDLIDPDRAGDVLEPPFAKLDELLFDFVAHLTIGVLGEADPSRLANPLDPRGDVDPVAHEIAVALLHDITDMNANAELDLPVLRDSRVAFDHAVLHLDRAAHGVDDAPELNDAAVAGAFDDAAAVGCDGRVDEIAAQAPQARECPVLIGAGEAAEPDDIGHQNRREFAGLVHLR